MYSHEVKKKGVNWHALTGCTIEASLDARGFLPFPRC